MSARIHIAGFAVRVGPFGRQLCAWCGARLQDYDSRLVASSDGRGPGFWETGALVAVDGGASWIVAHKDGDKLPAGWCGDDRPRLHLVEQPPRAGDRVLLERQHKGGVRLDWGTLKKESPSRPGDWRVEWDEIIANSYMKGDWLRECRARAAERAKDDPRAKR